jgi:hypothetical protein
MRDELIFSNTKAFHNQLNQDKEAIEQLIF